MTLTIDESFMQVALKQAEVAQKKDEVPVGAVLVLDNKIIAKSHNQVESLNDATAHAEMLVLTMGAEALGNWRLLKTTLYCTLEPCAMCLGAMLLSRVERVVWGAPDLRHGANGSWVNLLERPHPTHCLKVKSHVLADASAALLQQFFRKRRDDGCKE